MRDTTWRALPRYDPPSRPATDGQGGREPKAGMGLASWSEGSCASAPGRQAGALPASGSPRSPGCPLVMSRPRTHALRRRPPAPRPAAGCRTRTRSRGCCERLRPPHLHMPGGHRGPELQEPWGTLRRRTWPRLPADHTLVLRMYLECPLVKPPLKRRPRMIDDPLHSRRMVRMRRQRAGTQPRRSR
jgi:hypothetical protein